MVKKFSELIGKKDLCFKIYVDSAQNIPGALSANSYVQYKFKWDPETYKTEKCNDLQGNKYPKWNYERIHRIEKITKEIAKEL